MFRYGSTILSGLGNAVRYGGRVIIIVSIFCGFLVNEVIVSYKHKGHDVIVDRKPSFIYSPARDRHLYNIVKDYNYNITRCIHTSCRSQCGSSSNHTGSSVAGKEWFAAYCRLHRLFHSDSCLAVNKSYVRSDVYKKTYVRSDDVSYILLCVRFLVENRLCVPFYSANSCEAEDKDGYAKGRLHQLHTKHCEIKYHGRIYATKYADHHNLTHRAKMYDASIARVYLDSEVISKYLQCVHESHIGKLWDERCDISRVTEHFNFRRLGIYIFIIDTDPQSEDVGSYNILYTKEAAKPKPRAAKSHKGYSYYVSNNRETGLICIKIHIPIHGEHKALWILSTSWVASCISNDPTNIKFLSVSMTFHASRFIMGRNKKRKWNEVAGANPGAAPHNSNASNKGGKGKGGGKGQHHGGKGHGKGKGGKGKGKGSYTAGCEIDKEFLIFLSNKIKESEDKDRRCSLVLAVNTETTYDPLMEIPDGKKPFSIINLDRGSNDLIRLGREPDKTWELLEGLHNKVFAKEGRRKEGITVVLTWTASWTCLKTFQDLVDKGITKDVLIAHISLVDFPQFSCAPDYWSMIATHFTWDDTRINRYRPNRRYMTDSVATNRFPNESSGPEPDARRFVIAAASSSNKFLAQSKLRGVGFDTWKPKDEIKKLKISPIGNYEEVWVDGRERDLSAQVCRDLLSEMGASGVTVRSFGSGYGGDERRRTLRIQCKTLVEAKSVGEKMLKKPMGFFVGYEDQFRDPVYFRLSFSELAGLAAFTGSIAVQEGTAPGILLTAPRQALIRSSMCESEMRRIYTFQNRGDRRLQLYELRVSHIATTSKSELFQEISQPRVQGVDQWTLRVCGVPTYLTDGGVTDLVSEFVQVVSNDKLSATDVGLAITLHRNQNKDNLFLSDFYITMAPSTENREVLSLLTKRRLMPVVDEHRAAEYKIIFSETRRPKWLADKMEPAPAISSKAGMGGPSGESQPCIFLASNPYTKNITDLRLEDIGNTWHQWREVSVEDKDELATMGIVAIQAIAGQDVLALELILDGQMPKHYTQFGSRVKDGRTEFLVGSDDTIKYEYEKNGPVPGCNKSQLMQGMDGAMVGVDKIIKDNQSYIESVTGSPYPQGYPNAHYMVNYSKGKRALPAHVDAKGETEHQGPILNLSVSGGVSTIVAIQFSITKYLNTKQIQGASFMDKSSSPTTSGAMVATVRWRKEDLDPAMIPPAILFYLKTYFSSQTTSLSFLSLGVGTLSLIPMGYNLLDTDLRDWSTPDKASYRTLMTLVDNGRDTDLRDWSTPIQTHYGPMDNDIAKRGNTDLRDWSTSITWISYITNKSRNCGRTCGPQVGQHHKRDVITIPNQARVSLCHLGTLSADYQLLGEVENETWDACGLASFATYSACRTDGGRSSQMDDIITIPDPYSCLYSSHWGLMENWWFGLLFSILISIVRIGLDALIVIYYKWGVHASKTLAKWLIYIRKQEKEVWSKLLCTLFLGVLSSSYSTLGIVLLYDFGVQIWIIPVMVIIIWITFCSTTMICYTMITIHVNKYWKKSLLSNLLKQWWGSDILVKILSYLCVEHIHAYGEWNGTWGLPMMALYIVLSGVPDEMHSDDITTCRIISAGVGTFICTPWLQTDNQGMLIFIVLLRLNRKFESLRWFHQRFRLEDCFNREANRSPLNPPEIHVISWNTDGLMGDTPNGRRKRIMLKKLMKKAHVLLLQETHVNQIDALIETLGPIGKGWIIKYHPYDPSPLSNPNSTGGLISMFRSDKFKSDCFGEPIIKPGRIAIYHYQEGDTQITFANVHMAPCRDTQVRLDDIQFIQDNLRSENFTILGGDWNFAHESTDILAYQKTGPPKFTGYTPRVVLDTFAKDLLGKFSLKDWPTDDFTRFSSAGCSKIDRFYTSHQPCMDITTKIQTAVIHPPRWKDCDTGANISDHFPIKITIKNNQASNDPRLQTWTFSHPQFANCVRTAWAVCSERSQADPHLWALAYEDILTRSSQMITKHGAKAMRGDDMRKHRLSLLYYLLHTKSPNIHRIEELIELTPEIQPLIRKEGEFWRVNWIQFEQILNKDLDQGKADDLQERLDQITSAPEKTQQGNALWQLLKKLAPAGSPPVTVVADPHTGMDLSPADGITAINQHWGEIWAEKPRQDSNAIDQMWSTYLMERGTPNFNNWRPEDPLASIEDIIISYKKSSPGPNKLPPEAFKACPEISAEITWAIIQHIEAGGEVSPHASNFNNSRLVLLGKKETRRYEHGAAYMPGNIRPLSISDMFNRYIATYYRLHLMGPLEDWLLSEQNGFLAGRQGALNIHNFNMAFYDQVQARKEGFVILFDFKAAFSSLAHGYMHEAIHKLEFPQEFQNAYKFLMTDIDHILAFQGQNYPGPPVESGVKQGCPLSPLIFVTMVDFILWGLKNKDPTCKLGGFADDIAMYTEDIETVTDQVIPFFQEFQKVSGLELNLRKTKVLSTTYEGEVQAAAQLALKNLHDIEVVESAEYLGILFGRKLTYTDLWKKTHRKVG